ncbi:MAG: thiol peroxidase [Nostocoides sp.]
MAETTLGGNPVHTSGELPEQGAPAPAYVLTGRDLGDITPATSAGRSVVLNVFPSIDTAVCATSVRRFNELAGSLENTTVICVSMDLPFAMNRFCGAEGIDNVLTASGFRSTFGQDYGVTMVDGRLRGLYARSVVVIDPSGDVAHTELVSDIGKEPDYDAALAALN